MILYPNVKINLGLSILRKRADGFHELETLFIPYFGFRDKLEIEKSDQPAISLIGGDWDPHKDLSWRAWELMKDEYGIGPVSITLEKHSPVGAGLGGGSADAAFTLIALDNLFGLGLGQGRLASLAARLGSDCPFFIYNRPMLATGRGEILQPYDIDLSGYQIQVVLPTGISVSTKEAYSRVIPREIDSSTHLSLAEALTHPIEQWKDVLVNDFERSVFAIYPAIATLKQKLYEQGAIYASMSGSGSAVFSIMKNSQ